LAGKAHDLNKVLLADEYYKVNTKLTKEIFDVFLASKANHESEIDPSRIKFFYTTKVKKDGGISLLPKGGVSITMNSLLNTDQYIAIASGKQVYNGKNLEVYKLVPTDDQLEWVISTLWIDPVESLVYKTFTTTKENGSFEITMEYGAYANYGLPSKIIFGFNTKDYKLPNGITLEFGDEAPISKEKAKKNKKGTIEITYSKYTINKGVSNTNF
jgi:hypothetical protein